MIEIIFLTVWFCCGGCSMWLGVTRDVYTGEPIGDFLLATISLLLGPLGLAVIILSMLSE